VCTTSIQERCDVTTADIQQAFLSILPRLESYGRVFFRDLKCPERRHEVISEMVAIAWGWFVRIAQRGKDATKFVSMLATYAARAVRSGRRLCGLEPVTDVLSPRAGQRHSFTVRMLSEVSALDGNVFDQALEDNTVTPIIDQVQFRLDFPRWRATRCARDQHLIDDLMRGERGSEMAVKYGLSAGRVSQLRREFFQDWTRFCDGLQRPASRTSGVVG
jgi:hypothetical protein